MSTASKGYVYRAELDGERLGKLLLEYFRDGDWAIVRRVDGAELLAFRAREVGSLVGRWSEGRVFGGHADVRWRQTGATYSVLVLTEQECLPGDGFRQCGPPLDVESAPGREGPGFLTWGTTPALGRPDDENTWWEARIPRPLRYPGRAGKEPPRLGYRLYREGPVVRWVRLVEGK